MLQAPHQAVGTERDKRGLNKFCSVSRRVWGCVCVGGGADGQTDRGTGTPRQSRLWPVMKRPFPYSKAAQLMVEPWIPGAAVSAFVCDLLAGFSGCHLFGLPRAHDRVSLRDGTGHSEPSANVPQPGTVGHQPWLGQDPVPVRLGLLMSRSARVPSCLFRPHWGSFG